MVVALELVPVAVPVDETLVLPLVDPLLDVPESEELEVLVALGVLEDLSAELPDELDDFFELLPEVDDFELLELAVFAAAASAFAVAAADATASLYAV